MARANRELIDAWRRTAERLSGDVSYQWGHMGMCNCGHLAQSITGLADPEIHQSALIREGDWEQQARDYCPTSGNLIDVVLAAMFDLGLTRDDVRNLERLSCGRGRSCYQRRARIRRAPKAIITVPAMRLIGRCSDTNRR